MKVLVYVEGQSDRLSLEALLKGYREQLRQRGHGLAFLVLSNKDAFFKKLGPKAAAHLVESDTNAVVALPDLYPSQRYSDTPNAHPTFERLAERLRALVREALRNVHNLGYPRIDQAMGRFLASALKHDLEMLLLAACGRLGEQVGQQLNPQQWRHPVEDQNQSNPPKRVVEEIFRTKTRWAYRDTRDAPAVLRKVTHVDEILYGPNGQLECPVFNAFMDWVAHQTHVPFH